MANNTTYVEVQASDDPDAGQFTEERIAGDIWRYFSPIILIVGTIGNLLAMCVLLRKRMRSTTTMYYLAALGFADFFVLYTGLLRYWIREVYEVDFRNLTTFTCRIHLFLVYASLDTAVWILVAVTMDRTVFVCLPFRARRLCTIRNARFVLLGILVSMAVINIHFLWMPRVLKIGEDFVCDMVDDLPPYQFVYATELHPWIDFCVFSFIPFSVMIVCNVFIIRQMALSKKRIASHQNGQLQRNPGLEVDRPALDFRKTTQKPRRTNWSSVTVTLLTINIIFLFTTSPIVVFLLGYDDWSENGDAHDNAVLLLIWSIVNMLQYLNNAIHFFLYCLTGSRFRREFILLVRRRNKVSNCTDQSTTLEMYPTNTVQG